MAEILVTGATGKVGRELVSGLLGRSVEIRALVRKPDTAGFPGDVELAVGDLSDPQSVADHVGGVDAVFLLWPFMTADHAQELADVLSEGGRRVVYLSAEAAGRRPDAFWARVERAIEAHTNDWTFLRPTGFAANTMMWAEQIRRSDEVRWVYGQAARSLIGERDIAAVAIRALTEQGHSGQRYVLTGPETITQEEQVHAIGDALGRELRWVELSRDDVERQLEGVPDTALDTWASFARDPEIVTSTVPEITGRPAQSFADWAREHADAFR